MNINCIKLIIGTPIVFEDYSNKELILIDGSDIEIDDLPNNKEESDFSIRNDDLGQTNDELT